jgi:hypothetical protein
MQPAIFERINEQAGIEVTFTLSDGRETVLITPVKNIDNAVIEGTSASGEVILIFLSAIAKVTFPGKRTDGFDKPIHHLKTGYA